MKLRELLILIVIAACGTLAAQELPVYPGAKLVTQGVEGGASRIEYALPTNATQAAVSEFYRTKLSQTAGWSSIAVLEMPWGAVRSCKRKDSERTVGVAIIGRRLLTFDAPTSFGAGSINDWLSDVMLLAGPPVASINGVPINARDYYRRLEYMPASAQMKEAGLYILKDLINERLLEMMAKQENVLPTEGQIQQAMNEAVKQPGFEQKYREMGMSEDELWSFVRAQQVHFNLQTKGVAVTDQEIQAHYTQHKDSQFSTPEYAIVAAIFTDEKATLARAMEMLSQGADFGQVARELSSDETSAQLGGRMRRPIARTDPEIPQGVRDKVLTTEVGRYTDPIEGADGQFVIFKVLDRKPASVKPFDEVRYQIRQTLMLEKGSKVNNVQARLVEFRKGVTIKVNLKRYESRISELFRGE